MLSCGRPSILRSIMARQIKIPVIKNQGLILGTTKRRKRRPFAGLKVLSGVAVISALMLSFVWLKLETHKMLTQNRNLGLTLGQIRSENQKLLAEIETLKSIGNIQHIAESQLGLIFLPHENLIKIQP